MSSGLEIKQPKKHHTVRWIIAFIIIIFATIAGWYTYRWYTYGEPLPIDIPVAKADSTIDESIVPTTAVAEYTVPASNPRYISIPSLGIGNTRVKAVGVAKDGSLGVPDNINDTAWYNKSATPGLGYGAVLIDGHNGGVTRDGVFAKLGTLQPGDILTVERGDGQKFTYEVRENSSMPLDEVNSTGMAKMMQSAEPGMEGLNVITCDGKWVPSLKQFDRRIMLRAVIVDSTSN